MNKTSLKKLATAHDDLQMLAHAVNKRFPIQCICGERNEADQNKAHEGGYSKLKFPDSKHNLNKKKGRFKSHAIDIVPDTDNNPATINWDEIEEFNKMLKVVEEEAERLNIKIRLGRDFRIKDLPHVELAEG